MAQLLIRGLAEEEKEKLRERAKAHGRSLEAEARDVLVRAAGTGLAFEAEPEKGFGDIMDDCFGKRGLTPREQRRLKRAIDELRDCSMMRVPDFEAW